MDNIDDEIQTDEYLHAYEQTRQRMPNAKPAQIHHALQSGIRELTKLQSKNIQQEMNDVGIDITDQKTIDQLGESINMIRDIAGDDIIKTVVRNMIQNNSNTAKCDSCSTIDTNILQCSACKIARYCTKECQLSHWPIHKKQCRKANN